MGRPRSLSFPQGAWPSLGVVGGLRGRAAAPPDRPEMDLVGAGNEGPGVACSKSPTLGPHGMPRSLPIVPHPTGLWGQGRGEGAPSMGDSCRGRGAHPLSSRQDREGATTDWALTPRTFHSGLPPPWSLQGLLALLLSLQSAPDSHPTPPPPGAAGAPPSPPHCPPLSPPCGKEAAGAGVAAGASCPCDRAEPGIWGHVGKTLVPAALPARNAPPAPLHSRRLPGPEAVTHRSAFPPPPRVPSAAHPREARPRPAPLGPSSASHRALEPRIPLPGLLCPLDSCSRGSCFASGGSGALPRSRMFSSSPHAEPGRRPVASAGNKSPGTQRVWEAESRRGTQGPCRSGASSVTLAS